MAAESSGRLRSLLQFPMPPGFSAPAIMSADAETRRAVLRRQRALRQQRSHARHRATGIHAPQLDPLPGWNSIPGDLEKTGVILMWT